MEAEAVISWGTNGIDRANWCEDPYAKNAEILRPIRLLANGDAVLLQLI
jgi:hypothetical protein